VKRKTTNADALTEVVTILQDLIDSGWDAGTDAPAAGGKTDKLGTMIDEAITTAQAGAAADDDRETIKVLRRADTLAFDLGAKAVMDAVEACFDALDGIDDDSVTRSAAVETKGRRAADGWWVEVFVNEVGTKNDEDGKWLIEALCERLGGEFSGGGGGGSSFQGLFDDEESARSFIDAVEDLGYGEIEGSGSNDLTQDVHPSGMDERSAGGVETKGLLSEVRMDIQDLLADMERHNTAVPGNRAVTQALLDALVAAEADDAVLCLPMYASRSWMSMRTSERRPFVSTPPALRSSMPLG
jgi:hypothetical protein